MERRRSVHDSNRRSSVGNLRRHRFEKSDLGARRRNPISVYTADEKFFLSTPKVGNGERDPLRHNQFDAPRNMATALRVTSVPTTTPLRRFWPNPNIDIHLGLEARHTPVKHFVHSVNMALDRTLGPCTFEPYITNSTASFRLMIANYTGRKVAVTGADGFIGSHVVEALVRTGAEVTALALYNSFDNFGWLDSIDPKLSADFNKVRGDVRDSGFMMRLLKGQDICFHLAALIAIPYSYDAPQSYVDVNVGGTLNVLEAAREHGLSRLVHTSTSEVYGTAITSPISEEHPLQGQSPYSASKIGADMMVEAFARSFSLPVVTLRPFNTYGPRQSERAVISSTIRQALDPSCHEIRLGDLTPTRDFTFVADTAAAFLAIGRADGLAYGQAYNGGTGRAVTIGEAVSEITKLTGNAKPIAIDEARIRPEKSEVRALLADHGKLTRATGWLPGTSLQDGLSSTIDWWREQLEARRVRTNSSYMT
ncbi:MAG: SDR family NAD(P)-dependent oxidoreductase [Hyphomicrobium sp.]